MIEALVTGKLHQRAEERTSKGGKPFVTAKVRTAAGEADSLFVNVVAFSESACAALLARVFGFEDGSGRVIEPDVDRSAVLWLIER